jgi:hypothetical protein
MKNYDLTTGTPRLNNYKCNKCLHFDKSGNCLAFPDGIPLAITSGVVLHDRPTQGQENNVVFEPK